MNIEPCNVNRNSLRGINFKREYNNNLNKK